MQLCLLCVRNGKNETNRRGSRRSASEGQESAKRRPFHVAFHSGTHGRRAATEHIGDSSFAGGHLRGLACSGWLPIPHIWEMGSAPLTFYCGISSLLRNIQRKPTHLTWYCMYPTRDCTRFRRSAQAGTRQWTSIYPLR